MVPGSMEIAGRTLNFAVSDNAAPERPVPPAHSSLSPPSSSSSASRGLGAGHAAAESPQIWAVNLHGYFAGGGMYWRESARLAAGLGWRVVNPSLPGFGGSTALPWTELSMKGFARTIADLLDGLGAGPVVILGHSMGGAVAIQFAHDYPERTLGVIYRDGAATVSWKERRSVLARALSPLSPDLGAMADLASAVAVDLPDFMLGRIRSTVRGIMPDARRNLRGVADALPVAAMLFGSDLTEEAAHVARDLRIPLLPVWGTFDRITPRSTAEEFTRISGAEMTWVRGGHSWMIARPGTQRALLLTDRAGREFVRAVQARERAARAGALLPADVLPMRQRMIGGLPLAGR